MLPANFRSISFSLVLYLGVIVDKVPELYSPKPLFFFFSPNVWFLNAFHLGAVLADQVNLFFFNLPPFL